MIRQLLVSVACVFAVGSVGARPALAQAEKAGAIDCESLDGRYRHCSVKDLDVASVRIEEKQGRRDCLQDKTWGVDKGGIWVNGGCRARFAYTTGPGGQASATAEPRAPVAPTGAPKVAETAPLKQACVDRAAGEWKVDAGTIEATDPRQLATGDYEVSVTGQKAFGRCTVNGAGAVQTFMSR